MSRIGKKPVTIPSGVEVRCQGGAVSVKGPKGELERDITPLLSVVSEDGQLRVERPDDEKRSRELHGLTRTLINNMVVGVTEGYTRNLEIQGVGYRAQLVGKKLQLNLGYSHPIEIDPPEGISFAVEPGRAWYLPVAAESGAAGGGLFGDAPVRQEVHKPPPQTKTVCRVAGDSGCCGHTDPAILREQGVPFQGCEHPA